MSDNGFDLTLLGMKILFVEDDHGVLDSIAKILGRYVSELYVATNGKEGLHIYSLYKPDIVVTDIKMPIMDGLKMAREIRNLNPDAPIIIVSAFNESEYVAGAVDLGVCQYLFKPLELERLLDALRKCARDILLRRKIEEKTAELNANLKILAGYKKAIDIGAIVSKSDANNRIIDVNDAFCAAFGYKREELLGKSYKEIGGALHNAKIAKSIKKAIEDKTVFKGVVQNKNKNGDLIYFNLTIAPIVDVSGNALEYIDLRQDITSIVMRRYIDDLTGLPNRNALERDLPDAPRPGLFLLDLDDFNEINDVYGSRIGDLALIEIANTLRDHLAALSAKTRLYRISADEYCVLAYDQSECGGVRIFAESLLNRLENVVFNLDGFEILINAKVGYSISKADAFSKADMALRVAKRKHRSSVCAEDMTDIRREFSQNLEWIAKLKSAIAEDRVIPFFQPVVDLRTGAIVQYECLMRIIENDSVIEPPTFLAIARRTRQYRRLSQIVIEKSCEYFSDKSQDFSFNVSIDDMCGFEFKKRLKATIEKNGVARRLVIELSQKERLDDYPEAMEFINEFRALGCKFTLDDYGAGYASAKNLIAFKPDFIKLDSSISGRIDAERESLIYCETIAEFAEKLGVRTIAKHAHSEIIGKLANRVGIGYAQGFFYSKPTKKIGSE
ncbi:MAG: EAL domain-containing protein [Helicobacteraceae bacterium]|jgi:PAS domain S-box-containing protein/diguanylate cyclase (GGDEF)-like protein|nr:EAL domain-containing protein [Helicobacteraceae bacterium]